MATVMRKTKAQPAPVQPETNGTPIAPIGLTPLQAKFTATRKELSDALIERETEVDLALTAIIARETCLLVGPPGTGKSFLADSIMRWMNCRKFSCLIQKFTVPEELFGAIDVMGLKSGVYRRVTTNKLPEAEGAFLDEVFKGSSAILNTLLRILNERTFDNGDATPVKVPLKFVITASNEWPSDQEGGKELGALFDRFLFRRKVKPIMTAEGRKRLLWTRDHNPTFSTTISPAEIDQAHAEAMSLPWTQQAKDAYEDILRALATEGILPGDRRQFKAVAAAAAYAYLCGAQQVQPEHLDILANILWDDPAEQPEKVAATVGRIANPVGTKVNEHLREISQIIAAVDTRNPSAVVRSLEALKETATKLKDLPGGNGRVQKALDYLRSEYKRIQSESQDAIDAATNHF